MRLKVTNCRKEKENYNITVEYLDENPIKFYTDGKGLLIVEKKKKIII